MRNSVLTVLALTFSQWPVASDARQAELIGFSRNSNGAAIESGPSKQPVILEQMREALRPSAEADGRALPLETSFNYSCEDYRYRPTHWLSKSTERRRALYFPIMVEIACESGLPARLLDAVIAQESGYNPRAVSAAGAMGMMQIMPDTAIALGLTDAFDSLKNMRAGARYLRQQIDQFGRIDLALAAYNAGPGRRSLRGGYLPAIPETRSYVRAITTNWERLSQFSVEPPMYVQKAAPNLPGHAPRYREVTLALYGATIPQAAH